MTLPRGLQSQATAKVTFSNYNRAASKAQSNAQTFSSNADNITTGSIQTDVLPLATASTPGIVQPDDITITVDSFGVITAVGGGGPTTSLEITVTAGASLAGNTVVYIDSAGTALNTDLTNLVTALGTVGITTGAIASSAMGPVQIAGEMVEPSWTWIPGEPIWAATAGALTQTVPSGKWILEMGIATSATSMTVDPKLVISTP